MTDLRNALDRLLLDEPPLHDSTDRIVAAGRRARRRTATAAAGAASVVVVIGTLLAMPLIQASSPGQTSSLGTDATPPATAATPTPTGLDELNRTNDCPDGQGATITADLATTIAHGTVSQQGWLNDYVHQHLEGVINARIDPPVGVNGRRVATPSASAWVVITAKDHSVTTEYVIKANGSTWQAHPATFTGCAPKP